MATEIAKAYVQLVPSASGFKSSIKSQIGSDVTSAGTEAGTSFGSSMVSSLKAIILAAGLGTIIKEAFDVGAALEQNIGGVETLYKESSDTMLEYAQQAYETAGISANDYLEQSTSFAAALLSSLDGDTAAAAESANQAIIDMADNSNKMGTALESIQNAYAGFAKQNYTMLDNLKLGYGGTKEEMERLLADAQELTGVEYDISNLSDVYSAIHVIQEDLGITGTTAEEAATTFSGSLSSMKSAVTNLLGDIMIGNDISEDLSALQETVVTFFNNNFIPMLGNLVSSLPEIVTGLFQMAITEIGALTEGLPELFDFAAELFTNLAVAFVSNLPYLVASLYDLFVSAFNLLASMDIGQAVTDFLTLLQEEIEYHTWAIFNEDSSIVESVIGGIINASQMIVSQGSQIVISLINGILSMLPSLVETVGTLLTTMFEYIVEMLPFIVENGMNILMALVQGILENLPAMIDTVFSIITTILNTIIENLPEIIEAGFTIVTKLIIGLLNALPDLIASVLTLAANIIDLMFSTDWASIGVNIITGIIEGLKATVSALFDWLLDMAASALNKVKEFFGIASPSKVFRDEVGQWIPEGIAVGIEANAESVTDAMDALSSATLASYDVSALTTGNVTTSSTTEDVRTLSEKIDSLGETVGNAVSDAMSSGFDMTWNGRELGRLVKSYA